MKKRVLAVVLLLILLLTTACGSKETYAIKVGDRVVTENDYFRTMTDKRTLQLTYVEGAEDTKAYWASKSDSGQTLSEVMVETVQKQLIERKLYAYQFDHLGLSFTEEEDAAIQSALSQTIERYGSMSAFVTYLQGVNYTYEEFLDEQYDMTKKSKVLAHYYGANGLEPVKLQDIKDYYNVHNARIKMATILKIDTDEGQPLPEDELKKAKQKAQDAYDAAVAPSDKDTFENVIAVYSAFPEDIDDYVVNDADQDESFTKGIMEMKVGEILLKETDECFYVIKRYDGTADDFFTSTLQMETMEIMREDEIDAMLAEWKEEAGVKLNKKILDKYTPEKMIAE